MKKRPNFLLFMPETLRADAVFGPTATRPRTPNLDRLAEEGVAMTQCYAQNPICSPSRISMFTGLYPHARGQRSLLGLLKPEQRNLFRDLKDSGYRTVAYGKNDLLAQESIPLCFDEVERRVRPEPGRSKEPPPQPDDSRWKPTFYWGKRPQEDCQDGDWTCIQSALQFLDEDHEQPFCVYLPLSFVHPPYRVEEPFFSMHDLNSIPEPIPAEQAGKRSYMELLHQAHGIDKLSTEDLKEIKRVYYGMTSRIDHQLGLLVQKLKERDLYEDTVIVLFSDHGDYAGDYGMVEKYMVGFEDCLMNVPLVLRGPGVGTNDDRAALCEMTDLYPTLMELAGLEPQHYQHGRSLCPLMRGETDTHRDAVFSEGGHHPDEAEQYHVILPEKSPYQHMYQMRQKNPTMSVRAQMIRTDRWKYVYSPHEKDELYDLESDPSEIVNLAEDPTRVGVVAEMRERLLRWMLDTGDVLPPMRDPRGWKG